MYFLVPFIILVVCLGGILYIFGRKLQYIKKLEPAKEETPGELFHSFFPELVKTVKEVHIDEYKEATFMGVEKALRRMRLGMLKFERHADTLIKKIRASYNTDSSKEETVEIAEEPIKEIVENKVVSDEKKALDLKQEEQRLIIEIAKDTKNPELYELLGDLYVAMGNLIDAKESYQAAITLDGHRQYVQNKLDGVLGKIGQNTE